MDQQVLRVRQAAEGDGAAIRALVRGERLNPGGLTLSGLASGFDWASFLVAEMVGQVVGAVGIRKHSDGSRELSSLVVASDRHNQGVARRLIDALLASDRAPLWLITDENDAIGYRRWGFEPVEPCTVPVTVRFNWRVGNLARIVSLLKRQPKQRLVILERLPLERRKSSRAETA